MGAIGGILADICLTCLAAGSGTSGRLQNQQRPGAVPAQRAALQRGRPSSASHAWCQRSSWTLHRTILVRGILHCARMPRLHQQA